MTIRPAVPSDAARCLEIRGRTRENAVSAQKLATYGITAESWRDDIQSGALPGYVCRIDQEIVGYCFAIRKTGEIAVLALLPEHEGQGIGRELLAREYSDASYFEVHRLSVDTCAVQHPGQPSRQSIRTAPETAGKPMIEYTLDIWLPLKKGGLLP